MMNSGALRTAAILLASLFLTSSVAQTLPTIRDQVRSYRIAHEADIVRQFAELLSIPNLASDASNIRKNADHISAAFAKRGAKMQSLDTNGGPSLVRTPTLGGTVPMYLFSDVLKTPVIGVPIANHGQQSAWR